MSATDTQTFDNQTQADIPPVPGTSKMGIVPISSVIVVDQKHPLKDDFFSPRNTYKPEPAMVNSIRANGGPDYAPKVWPWKDAEGNQQLIVIDGNQRVIAAKAAGLDKIKVDVQLGMSQQDASRLATRTNAQRKDNSFATNCIFAIRMVQPDANLKPQGLTYEKAAAEFGKTHTWVRNHVKAWKKLPANIRQDIEKGKISSTLVFNALLNDVLLNDPDALQARYAELIAEGGPVEGGEKSTRSPRTTVAKAKNPDALTKNEWQLIALAKETPEDAATLIQVFIGEKSFAQAQAEGLDWLKKPAKEASEKAKGKGKGTKGKGKAVASSIPTVNAPVSDDIDMDLFS